MARKLRKLSDYDIQVGFIHEFEYKNSRYSKYLNGHPIQGRLYRIIKDPRGYRLHIGKENNGVQLDGLFLGEDLTAERRDFRFRIELVTQDNYLQLPILSEDHKLYAQWLDSENKELWGSLSKETEREEPVTMKRLEDFIGDLIEGSGETPEGMIMHISNGPSQEKPHRESEEYQVAERISKGLNVIGEIDAQMMMIVADLLELIASRYTNPKMQVGDIYEVSKSLHHLIFTLNNNKK